MSERVEPVSFRRGGWLLALLGQFVFVFAVVALSGPGRMDIIDGQPRYEVARSLVEHGDPIVRNPDVTFCVFPGRDGRPYSLYRLPQSVAGVPALLLADATGPVSEVRRQFFFTLVSPFTCGILAVVFSLWFRGQGHRPAAALGWSLAGIFCTPCWFYGTSVFDDILGTTAIVSAITLAWYARGRHPRSLALLAGIVIGLAFNCKQPLGIFVLPVLALTIEARPDRRTRWQCIALVLGGLSLGLAAYWGYEWYKFPPGSTDEHPRLLAQYVPAFPGTPLAGALGLLISPGAGLFLYCPTVIPSLAGLILCWRKRRLFVASLTAACLVFFGFIASMSIFKGDLSWGPRYLTPVVAVLWLFAPAAIPAWSKRRVTAYASLAFLVQLLALSVDYHRLYVELRFSSAFYYQHPWIYFNPRAAHLVNRPREIWEILTEKQPADEYSPVQPPTAAMPCPETFESGSEAVRKYHCLNSFRPWWSSMRWLPPQQRPVALGTTVLLLLSCAGVGAMLLAFGQWMSRRPGQSSRSHANQIPVAPLPHYAVK